MDFSKDVKDLHRDSMAKVNASLSVSGVMTERRDARRQRVKSELSLLVRDFRALAAFSIRGKISVRYSQLLHVRTT